MQQKSLRHYLTIKMTTESYFRFPIHDDSKMKYD